MSEAQVVKPGREPLPLGEVAQSSGVGKDGISLVNQGACRDTYAGQDTQTDGTRREHDAAGRGQDVEKCSPSVQNSPAIPTEPRAFGPWLRAQNLPGDLYDAGYRVLLGLLIERQKAWSQSFALRKLIKAERNYFTTAYREHREERA